MLQKNTVNRRVVEPLSTLADLFDGPSLLIDKRNDKLLDYDNVLARSEKSQDKRLVGHNITLMEFPRYRNHHLFVYYLVTQ